LIVVPFLFIALACFGFVLFVVFQYLYAQYRALSLCTRAERVLSPSVVWLQLLPFGTVLVHFVCVWGIAESSRNAFERRGDLQRSSVGFTVGVFHGVLLGIHFLLSALTHEWIGVKLTLLLVTLLSGCVYWGTIAGLVHRLEKLPRPEDGEADDAHDVHDSV
jgi:hypothetical protein